MRGRYASPWKGDDVWKLAILALVVCVLSFIIVDCSSGTTRYFKCQVADRHYKAAYDESDTDKDGNVTWTHHDAEYHLYCVTMDDAHKTINVSTTSGRYERTADWDIVWVKTRCGRWTGGAYLPVIVDQPPTAEK